MYNGVPCYTILAAGGVGNRAGGGIAKQFRTLCGKTVIARSFELFENHPSIDGIVTVINQSYAAEWDNISKNYKKALAVAYGGETRQKSVYSGLLALKSLIAPSPALVLVHDAARPLTAYSIINGVIEAAFNYGGAVAAVPVYDTVKAAASGFVEHTPDRDTLFFAQTPQAFWLGALIAAHKTAEEHGFNGYDDASLIERFGGRVKLTEGSRGNIKITLPEDFITAEFLLSQDVNYERE
jgi:2-C-methyl-D-erythritol 4-phosphate cytidylyltransferase